jgi:hypothetical protein
LSSSEKLQVVGPEFSFAGTKPPQSRHPLSSISTARVEVHPRQINQISPPHSNLLQGLYFQIECQRPLHLKREENVLVKVVH